MPQTPEEALAELAAATIRLAHACAAWDKAKADYLATNPYAEDK